MIIPLPFLLAVSMNLHNAVITVSPVLVGVPAPAKVTIVTGTVAAAVVHDNFFDEKKDKESN